MPSSSTIEYTSDARRWGQASSSRPRRPELSRKSTRSSPRRRTFFVGHSSSSAVAAIGNQYRRSSSPIGVPAPTRVRISFFSADSIGDECTTARLPPLGLLLSHRSRRRAFGDRPHLLRDPPPVP